MMDRGGIVGETLYWVISTLFSDVGAHLAFVVLAARRPAAPDRRLHLAADRPQLQASAQRCARHARACGHRARTRPRRRPQAHRLRGAAGRAAHRGAAITSPRTSPPGEVEDRRGRGRGARRRGEDPLAQVEREIQRARARASSAARGHERPRALHAAGQAALCRDRVRGPELRAARAQAAAPVGQGPGARHVQPGRDLHARWWSRWAISASRPSSSAASPARASRATSCGSRPAPRSRRSRS